MNRIESFMGLEDHRIRFTTGEGPYEGTISIITPKIELLVIRNLIWLPKNSKMGTLTFRAHEIRDFKVIGRSESPKPVFTANTRVYHQESQKYTLADDELCDYITDNESVSISDTYSEEKYELKLPPNLLELLPTDHIVISCLNDDFHSAFKHLKRQNVIGLSLESPKIGRHETLHWLCISTESCTFLFDIQELGENGFINGLKSILEESSIEKVVHDCREISDCLYHQFNTRLVNVFDTQIADFIVNNQRKRKVVIDHHVRSLNSCLSQYLNIPNEYLYCRKKRSYYDDLVFFGLRPLNNDLKDLFIKNVIYLRKLKQELDSCLVEPVKQGTDIYLHALSSKTDKELQLEEFNPDIIPNEFMISQIKLFHFEKYVPMPSVVSSGPPYRRIESIFNRYFDYCERFKVGEDCDSITDKSILEESEQITQPDIDISLHESDSCSLADSNVSDENPWVKLREAFANLRPVSDEGKCKFVPAGMAV